MAGPSAVVVVSRGCGLTSSRHGDHDAGSIQEVRNPDLKTSKSRNYTSQKYSISGYMEWTLMIMTDMECGPGGMEWGRTSLHSSSMLVFCESTAAPVAGSRGVKGQPESLFISSMVADSFTFVSWRAS